MRPATPRTVSCGRQPSRPQPPRYVRQSCTRLLPQATRWHPTAPATNDTCPGEPGNERAVQGVIIQEYGTYCLLPGPDPPQSGKRMTAYLVRPILTLLGCVALLLASLPFAAASLAQTGTQDIYIWTYENDGSGSSTDACYVLLGYSQEGCDLNGDGAVLFEDVAYGTYTVRQTADLGPGRYVDDFTITVNGGVPDFAAFIVTTA